MTFSKAEIGYETREPRVQHSDHANELAKSYERVIRSSILSNLKYTCPIHLGKDKDIELCPVSQIAEELWNDDENCSSAIKSVFDGSTDKEIGAKFRALVESILNKISKECAETKITLEELGELK